MALNIIQFGNHPVGDLIIIYEVTSVLMYKTKKERQLCNVSDARGIIPYDVYTSSC